MLQYPTHLLPPTSPNPLFPIHHHFKHHPAKSAPIPQDLDSRYLHLSLQSAIAAPFDLAIDAFQNCNVWAGVASGAAPVDKIGLVGPDVLPGVGAVGHFGLCSEELKRESISGVDGKWSWENRDMVH